MLHEVANKVHKHREELVQLLTLEEGKPVSENDEPLVRHADVPVIAFTGRLATGQKIASIGAPMMKKLHLELGGKDATVIAEDADPEIAAKAVAYAALINAGQVCTSTERVYLPKKSAAKFTEAIV